MRPRPQPCEGLAIRPSSGIAGAPLIVEGEIDIASAVHLRSFLTGCLLDGHSVIDVDLGAVTFCDSSGLHVFLDIAKAAAEAGGCLRLHKPTPMVARLFALTGTGTRLLVLPTSVPPPPVVLPGTALPYVVCASVRFIGQASRRLPGPSVRRHVRAAAPPPRHTADSAAPGPVEDTCVDGPGP
ncbi:STAS domain-containing protein [Yinghuangia soli]|uniref:STAS domain-containing protein n=1 Tax=Yinghuangia soli TaxID=2908204 RepID=A0AA41Q7V2_9ACTN|nr:STAS domain-containing protein [Yinghuangia soli]MCF2532852.1 STAS domain-containing protein [Yinghuangia soli]